MDKREFSPEEIAKAMCLCYGNNWDISDGDCCDCCPYEKFPLNYCTQRLLSDAISLLVEKFGGGDTDGN